MRFCTSSRAVTMMTGVASPRAAQLAQHLEPVAPGQAEVEQHEIEARRAQRLGGAASVAHAVDRIAVLPERRAQALGDHPIIFHDEHAHRSLSPAEDFEPAPDRSSPGR